MSDLVCCPKCGSDQLVALGEEKPNSVINFTQDEEEAVLANLSDIDNSDRRCLSCGYSWNQEELLIQQQEDQNQLNALSFGERTEKFYADYDSGHFADARQMVPIEALSVYKRKGLKAAYRYLKLLDIKLSRFKTRARLTGIAILLVLVGVWTYACS